mgnify:CR=1 FL=1
MEKWESKGYNMIEKKNNKLMVISMSGGLDSSTLAARALAEGYLVLPVNFYYGQVNEVEIQAQRPIVQQLKMVYGYDKVLNSVHINLSYSLGDAIHNWQKNRDIGKYNDDLALEYYMPSRNLLFMSLAAVLGEIVAKDMPEVNELLLGLGIHKHSDVYARDYWDITPEFASRLQSLLSLNDAIKVSLYAPYANGYKKDIVLDSIKYGVRYDYTWTCYSPNKEIVSISEMVDRLKAALDAKVDSDFVVMARTDALSVEGLDAAVERAVAFQEAGADMIFAEALTDIEMYRKFTDVLDIPVLANMTEFGQTDLYTTEQLHAVGVDMVLYPLSAFRAMNKAALNVYQHLLDDGTQDKVVDTMQTRMELYDFLNYHEFEQTLDKLFADNK